MGSAQDGSQTIPVYYNKAFVFVNEGNKIFHHNEIISYNCDEGFQ